MDKAHFDKLLEGIHHAGNVLRGEKKPSRVFEYSPVDIQHIREDIGLSQNQLARLIHISVKTLQNWEQGRRKPQGPALALLTMLKRDPKHTLKALY